MSDDIDISDNPDAWKADRARRWAALSDKARELAEELVDRGDANLARQATLSGAIAADKALLLAGQVTSRTERLESPDQASTRLLEMFAAIRTRESQAVDVLSRPATPVAALPTGDHHSDRQR